MRSGNNGFTLLEIMIVVTIIGILAGISIPVYMNFAARAEAGSALGTLAPLKTNVENALAGDSTTDLSDLGNLGTSANISPLGTIQSTLDSSTGTGELVFTFTASSPMTIGRQIRLARANSGSWTCLSDLDTDHKPTGCN